MKKKWIIFALALAMMGGVAATLTRLSANEKLGLPGIKTAKIAGSQRLDIYLPERVLQYGSTNIPTAQPVLDGLPPDTSFAQRQYVSTSDPNDWLDLMVVLMGTDRTSIHKPQFCLKGTGWDLDTQNETGDVVPIDRPHAYDLPVAKLMMQRTVSINGQMAQVSGIYLYWYVADTQLTRSHFFRNWRSTTHLLKTGELDRWAYIGCLAICQPGDEAKTLERMKKFLAASVPEFQLTTGSGESAARQTASK